MKVKLNSSDNNCELFCTYEWLPSSNHEDLEELTNRVIECNKEFKPLFCSVPWHNITPPVTESTAFKFAISLQNRSQDVMYHICCRNLTKSTALQILSELKKNSIRNVFVLRGDLYESDCSGCFKYAKDLVQYIRSEFGSYFRICVAGYPSGHPENCNQYEELKYLKEKVDAGADFIISQIVFHASEFVQFVKNCKSIGIQVPIIPGILPIQDFNLAERISKKCSIVVPNLIKEKCLELCENPEELENFIIQETLDIIKNIVNSGIDVPGIHFFTFNRPTICLKIRKELYNILQTSKS